jgi:hypothetical protein
VQATTGDAVGDKYGRTLKLNIDATYLAVGALFQDANSTVDKVRHMTATVYCAGKLFRGHCLTFEATSRG